MHVTLDDVIQATRELAAEFPDNVYEKEVQRINCFYTKGPCSNGSCGCLIGQALIKAGVPKERLEEFDAKEQGGVSTVAYFLGIPLVNDKLWWLESVQSWQDMGNSWRACIEHAEAKFGEI